MAFSPEASFPEGGVKFSLSLLGGRLTQEAERHLNLAAQNYLYDDIAETHLYDVLRLEPDHPAVLIGLYRYYFYKGRLEEALDIAKLCLGKASYELGLPDEWRLVQPSMAKFGAYEEIGPRFFLFSLKGYAYLNMRLGHMSEGRYALEKLLMLDPSDKIGARVLLDVILRSESSDDD